MNGAFGRTGNQAHKKQSINANAIHSLAVIRQTSMHYTNLF